MLSQEKEIEGGPQMRALIRAGRELAGNMPLAELFKLIMNLSMEAVGAARGVLMTLEGEELVVQRGAGRRISDQQHGARPRHQGENVAAGARRAPG